MEHVISYGTKTSRHSKFDLATQRRERKPSKKVLLIEDDRLCQLIQIKVLVDLGYKVELAKNVAEGIAKFSTEYDFIVLDYNLPDGTGIEVTKAIRARDDGRKIPIIGLSAAAKENRVDCLLAGYSVMLDKPINAFEVAAAIELFYPV